MQDYNPHNILHPISKNLEIDDFWILLSELEKRAVRKYASFGSIPYEELLCESDCMRRMVEWVKKDNYVPLKNPKENLLQMLKYLIQINNFTMNNAVSLKNFQSIQDEQNKYLPVDDEEDEQELEDLPVVDINDKIRELRDSSQKKVGMKRAVYNIMLELGTDRKVVVPELERQFPNATKRVVSVTVSHVLKALGKQRLQRYHGTGIESIARKNWREGITYREFCRLMVPYTTSGHTVRHYWSATKKWYKESHTQ